MPEEGQRATGTASAVSPNYYGAFVLDPDGHNIEAVCPPHDPYNVPEEARMIIRCCSRAVSRAAFAASHASAQAWPDKPIKFVMTAPAGSSIDVLGRTIADKLKDRLGQPVVVENKPAAGGTVATAEVAQGRAGRLHDGARLSTVRSRSRRCCRRCPTTSQKDLAPVITTSSQPNVLAVNATLPVKNVAELVAYAKANPGKLNYASVGNGSSSHLNDGAAEVAWPASTPCTCRSTARRRR